MQSKCISSIELYAWDDPDGIDEASRKPRYKRYGILRITCGIHQGIGQCLLSNGTKREDLIRWGSYLRTFRKCKMAEALQFLEKKGSCWSHEQHHLVRTALMNLMENRIQARLYGTIMHTFLSYQQLCQRRWPIEQGMVGMPARTERQAAARPIPAAVIFADAAAIKHSGTLDADNCRHLPRFPLLREKSKPEAHEWIQYATAYYSVL
ncbi:hypothetical protein [Paenibacillus sp. 1001270B_150601_E10]|uniref:hypothetical protein n=1 Tax=Paenibacillus sp. 1001270B_150601_E10 TaxID=2787079 RepID=UPI00189F7CDD|nr:hypothetical protein [Paenibacillus sp. 1001270B_150601_E10]